MPLGTISAQIARNLHTALMNDTVLFETLRVLEIGVAQLVSPHSWFEQRFTLGLIYFLARTRLRQLTLTFDLRPYCLTRAQARMFALITCPGLKHLKLRSDPYGNPFGKDVAAILRAHEISLEHVDLTSCGFRDKDNCLAVCDALPSLKHLRDLRVSFTTFTYDLTTTWTPRLPSGLTSTEVSLTTMYFPNCLLQSVAPPMIVPFLRFIRATLDEVNPPAREYM